MKIVLYIRNILILSAWGLRAFASTPVPPLIKAESIPLKVESILTLDKCLELTEQQNLELQRSALEYFVREAQSKQSALPINPVLESEFENMLGTGQYKSFGSLESYIGINQEFELGSKRKKRKSVSEGFRNISGWEYQSLKRMLRKILKSNYFELLAYQEKLKLLKTNYQLHKKVLEYSSIRHEMGKAPITEKLKANIQLSISHMEIDALMNEMVSAKQKLAVLWSESEVTFDSVLGDLFIPIQLPSQESVRLKLNNNPEIIKLQKEFEYLEKSKILEKATSIPNVGLGLGSKYDASVDNIALKLSLTMGLPLWNQNKEGVKAIQIQIQQKLKQQEELKLQYKSVIFEKYEKINSLNESLEHLKTEILPEAEKVEMAVLESYRAGRIGQLEALDSQRIWLESQMLYIDSRLDYLKNLLHLEYISGIEFVHFNNNEDKNEK